jgi:hypothetical protein
MTGVTDVCIFVEVDGSLNLMAYPITQTMLPQLSKSKLASTIASVFRQYMHTITCDGRLAVGELHEDVGRLISLAGDERYLDNDDEERPLSSLDAPAWGLLSTKDSLIFQHFWLNELRFAFNERRISEHFSEGFCRLYTDDFHYQLAFEVDGVTAMISPLQLALKSWTSFASFLIILSNNRTDLARFASIECTMPRCTYTQQMLTDLFSVDWSTFTTNAPTCFERGNCTSCEWESAIDVVRSGRSLASLMEALSEGNHCVCCSLANGFFNESDYSQLNFEEYTNEQIGFVEDETEEDRGNDEGLPIAEEGELEEDTGAGSSSGESGDPSDEDSSGDK